MDMTQEDYGNRKVTLAFDAIPESAKPATQTTNVPAGSIIEPLARLNSTDPEWCRFKWNRVNYRVLESIFLASTAPVNVKA
jgi:hypothetical protein